MLQVLLLLFNRLYHLRGEMLEALAVGIVRDKSPEAR